MIAVLAWSVRKVSTRILQEQVFVKTALLGLFQPRQEARIAFHASLGIFSLLPDNPHAPLAPVVHIQTRQTQPFAQIFVRLVHLPHPGRHFAQVADKEQFQTQEQRSVHLAHRVLFKWVLISQPANHVQWEHINH